MKSLGAYMNARTGKKLKTIKVEKKTCQIVEDWIKPGIIIE
jgi:hypothetical protein